MKPSLLVYCTHNGAWVGLQRKVRALHGKECSVYAGGVYAMQRVGLLHGKECSVRVSCPVPMLRGSRVQWVGAWHG